MNRTIQIAPVRKTIVIDATPERTFAVFTAGIDRWWPRGHGIGAAPLVKSVIEPFVGGRWYTTHENGAEVTVGHVRAWEPPGRFVVGWEITPDWKPEPRVELSSEVEVRFLPEAGGRTRLELEHRNFERMGAAAGETMRKGVEGGWPRILELLAAEAAQSARAS
ncbi:MAG TPA: SRPBCC family protein [Steroidobacteraceae bacterium]|nr:SRPBCC family protein [Steroidobacteraceae bacterium]